MSESHRSSEKAVLGVILFSRANLNLSLRFTYLFLPAISRGLGVSPRAVSTLVSVRSLTGVGAPLFGVMTDRLGGQPVMSLGLALLVVGAALITGPPWYGLALLSFGVLGLSKSAYDPAVQAYLGHRVPYERRGRAMGIAELAWSAAWFGIPICGWLIDHVSWRAPFALVAALGIFAWWLTRRILSPDPKSRKTGGECRDRSEGLAELLSSFKHLRRDRHARLAITIAALLMLAQDNLIVVYGLWMEDTFGLTVTALGVVTVVIGVAEVVAELGVALLSDRLGKRRAVFVSLIITASGYLLLPWLNGSLIAALAGTAFLVLAFEFSIVAFIPIVSGLNATARGTLMSLNVAAVSLGRTAAAPIAVALYKPGNLTRNGLLSAVICLLLLGFLSLLRERGH